MSDRGFPEHFDGRRFYNPGAPQARGFLDVLRWKLRSHPEPSPAFILDVQQSTPPRRTKGGVLRITMVNHSTVLIQRRKSNILMGPIWSERASPVSWLGPRRRRKPGVRIDDLPDIDTVLISHNHYDHLDLRTLRQIAARGRSTFIVATGGARLLRSEQIEPVHRAGLGRITDPFGLQDPLRPSSALLSSWDLGPQQDALVRLRNRIPRATRV
jgi:Beta-lactamase superfamily domain